MHDINDENSAIKRKRKENHSKTLSHLPVKIPLLVRRHLCPSSFVEIADKDTLFYVTSIFAGTAGHCISMVYEDLWYMKIYGISI